MYSTKELLKCRDLDLRIFLVALDVYLLITVVPLMEIGLPAVHLM